MLLESQDSTDICRIYTHTRVCVCVCVTYYMDFPGNSACKNPPAMQETPVGSLCREDPLEEGMEIHSSILAWKIPMNRRAWQAAVHGVTKSQT